MSFTCPECGGHEFGRLFGSLPEERMCHGYTGEGFRRAPCTFQWPEADDEKYGILPGEPVTGTVQCPETD